MNNNVLEVDHSKAGMQGVDKAAVDKIVNEMSKNSPYYINEQRKQDARDKRIAKLLRLSAEFDQMNPTKLNELKQAVDREVNEEILACAHVGRYAHCDMDAFHAAVEQLDQPELKDKPFAVGGSAMLGTSSYLARKFGVRAAMPGYIAKKLCPELIIVPPHFEKYERATQKVRKEAAKFDPDFHSHGGDELCVRLDRSAYERAVELIKERRSRNNNRDDDDDENGDSSQIIISIETITEEQIVTELRTRINEATQLTASAGVGPTRMLAKICSNFNKPNGQFILEAKTVDEVKQYTWDNLTVRQIPGIGKVTDQMLQRLGIKTCKEMFDNRYRLKHCFLPKTFSFLLSASVGLSGAIKSTKLKNRHHGFFIKHPSLAKKLNPGENSAEKNKRKQQQQDDDDDDEKGVLPFDFSSSSDDSDEDKNNNNEDSNKNDQQDNSHGDESKHSVGCERTFKIAQVQNDKGKEQEEALSVVRKVFVKSFERLLEVTPCRIYQITVKAKRTTYEVSNSSANVNVIVMKEKAKVVVKNEPKDDDNDDDDDENSKNQEQEEETVKDWEEEHYGPGSHGFTLEKLNQFKQMILQKVSDDNKPIISSEEDFDSMLAKFTTLCEKVGFVSSPHSYRLMGCRFAYQPGMAAIQNYLNNNSNNTLVVKKEKKEVVIDQQPSQAPARRQRTLDDFFNSSNNNNNNSSATLNNSAKAKSNSNQRSSAEVIDLDLEDDDDDLDQVDDDDDDEVMMMMAPPKKIDKQRQKIINEGKISLSQQSAKSKKYVVLDSEDEDDEENSNDVLILSLSSD